MKQGWKYTTFTDVMNPTKSERCGDRTDLPILSITMRQGIIFQNERFKKVIASKDTKDYKIIKEGQLVIAFPIDEGLIYTQNIVKEGIMSPAYSVWDVDYSKLNNKFLNIYFHSPWAMNYYKSKLRGTTLRRRMIPKEALLAMPIPVPPLEEQERIVEELDCLSGVIEKKREQLKQLDALAQSIFYQMFGDPITNEKGWQVKKWNDIISIVNGKNQKAVENPNGEFPIYGSGGIMGYADKYLCPQNTIVIGRKGNINKPIFVKEPFWNVDTAFGLIADNEHIAPSYLFFYCRIFDFEQLNKAVTIPSLTKSDLLLLETPCPPIHLQQEFADKIEAIEKQKELIKHSITETEELFNSRMDYYFN